MRQGNGFERSLGDGSNVIVPLLERSTLHGFASLNGTSSVSMCRESTETSEANLVKVFWFVRNTPNVGTVRDQKSENQLDRRVGSQMRIGILLGIHFAILRVGPLPVQECS